jgi:hypothetical protein
MIQNEIELNCKLQGRTLQRMYGVCESQDGLGVYLRALWQPQSFVQRDVHHCTRLQEYHEGGREPPPTSAVAEM